MLHTSAYLLHSVFHELFGMHKLRLEFVVFISCSEHVVGAHAPGIYFIALLTESITVVARCSHCRYALSIEGLDRVGD